MSEIKSNACPYCDGPYGINVRCTPAGYCVDMQRHVDLVTDAIIAAEFDGPEETRCDNPFEDRN